MVLSTTEVWPTGYIISSYRLGDITLTEDPGQRYGLKSELSVSCGSCCVEAFLDSSSSVTEKEMSYHVNRRAVYHSLETGGGYKSLASFCSIMNMSCISKPAYQKQLKTILDVLEQEAKEEMANAVKEIHESTTSEELNDDGVVDTAVSFDGTWEKEDLLHRLVLCLLSLLILEKFWTTIACQNSARNVH